MNDVINVCANYGLQGICLAMMFYLCVVTIRANTKAINNLEKTLAQQMINMLKADWKKERCPDSGKLSL
jgi:hypothetical protein